jgi:hypothetical protein
MPVATVSSALASTTRDTPQFTLSPSSSLCPRSPVLHRVAEAPPPSTRALVVPLPPFKGLRVFFRGNQLSPAPNFSLPCPRMCAIARWSKVVQPLSHPAMDSYLPRPLHYRHAHARVRHVPLNHPEPFSMPWGPQRAAPSSPVGLYRGSERRHRWRLGSPARASC